MYICILYIYYIYIYIYIYIYQEKRIAKFISDELKISYDESDYSNEADKENV